MKEKWIPSKETKQRLTRLRREVVHLMMAFECSLANGTDTKELGALLQDAIERYRLASIECRRWQDGK